MKQFFLLIISISINYLKLNIDKEVNFIILIYFFFDFHNL